MDTAPGIGSVFDGNPAGQMGPRGCEPLANRRLSRIASGLGDWNIPTVTQFTPTGTPVRVAKANPNRANMIFAFRVDGDSALFVSPSRAGLLLAVPAFTFGVRVATSQIATVSIGITFQAQGGLVCAEWWALAVVGMGSGTLSVTEHEYLG